MRARWRWMGAFALLVGVAYLLLLWNAYRTNEQTLRSEAKLLLHDLGERLLGDLEEIGSDLFYLGRHAFDERRLPTLAASYATFVGYKSHYDKLRYVDASGAERIRIRREGGKAVAISAAELTDLSSAPFFNRTVVLERGMLYISPMELSREGGAIEVPINPVIRFATPVVDSQGEKAGVLALDYRADAMLEKFKAFSGAFRGKTLLLNEAGYYLVGFDSEDAWGFMFADKQEHRFGNFNPAAWAQMERGTNGQFEDKEGWLAYVTLDPERVVNNVQGYVRCQECRWKAVAYVPHALVMAQTLKTMHGMLPLTILVLFSGWVAIWIYFSALERRLQHESEIERLHNAIASERDLFISGPTVVMEFRNAYGWPITYVSENTETLLGYPAQRFETGDMDLASIIAPEHLERFTETVVRAQRDGKSHFEHEPFAIVASEGRRVWMQDSISISRGADGKIDKYLGYFNDISPLRNAQEEVRKSAEFVQVVVDSIADPTLVIDVKNHEVVLANKAARTLYLQEGEQYAAMPCYRLTHARDEPCAGEESPCPLQMILETKKEVRVTHRHDTRDGRSLYVELVATPIFDEHGEVVQIIESHRDVSHHIQLENELTLRATVDKLTQAYNRAKFDEELLRQFENAQRYGISLGVVMFDIDHFKMINDTYGHDAGDRVLSELSDVVRSHIRRYDIFARWGGEEFTILIPQSSSEALEKMAENLRGAIEAHAFETVGRITASFGATLVCKRDTVDTMMKRVDTALYRAKEEGRNRIMVLECGCDVQPCED